MSGDAAYAFFNRRYSGPIEIFMIDYYCVIIHVKSTKILLSYTKIL